MAMQTVLPQLVENNIFVVLQADSFLWKFSRKQAEWDPRHLNHQTSKKIIHIFEQLASWSKNAKCQWQFCVCVVESTAFLCPSSLLQWTKIQSLVLHFRATGRQFLKHNGNLKTNTSSPSSLDWGQQP